MELAGVPGVLLPWRDILHDGPVPGGLSLRELSKVRAEFIVGQGWGSAKTVTESFNGRNMLLESWERFDKVILWFEHDLYDQLQLVQILDWFHENLTDRTRLSLICSDRYLGWQSPEDMAGLLELERPVTEDQLLLASRAWTAFRSPAPEDLCEILKMDTGALPFLEGAIARLLEEYPNCANGLSRTEQHALQIIRRGEKRPGRIFGLYQETEERRFLGDASFWVMLHEFLDASPPLLELPPGKRLTLPTSPDQELTITPAGADVLDGKLNWLDIAELDCWIGGVHLTPDNTWCRDEATGVLKKQAA